MNSTHFGPVYANHYDLLYAEKNYEAECDLLEEVFRRFANTPVRSVLDMGCGTGGHAVLLAKRGYQVTGIDRSSYMVGRAQTKALEASVEVKWVEGDIQTIQVDRSFDAVILMFAVMGYQTTNADVLAVLSNVQQSLRAGGLLAFDIWYGPAVLAIQPGDRVKVIEEETDQLIRTATSTLDVRHHLCNVRYSLWQLAVDRLVSRSEEVHQMRFFFPMELELILASTGFELVSLTAFPDILRPADEGTWNAFCVSRKA